VFKLCPGAGLQNLYQAFGASASNVAAKRSAPAWASADEFLVIDDHPRMRAMPSARSETALKSAPV